MKTISDSKLVTFALGKQQKSRFQKAREEKEAKKRQDEQEAAREYDSFVASFVDEEGSSKVFIRGGQQVNSAVTDGVGIAPGAVYKPERNTRSDNNNINSEVVVVIVLTTLAEAPNHPYNTTDHPAIGPSERRVVVLVCCCCWQE